MYCHQCGSKQVEGSRFCANCGVKLDNETNYDPTITENTDAEESRESRRASSSKIKRMVIVLVPLLSLLLVGGGVFGYYSHETNVNEKVLTLKASAERYALEGDYKQALKELDEAITLRPDYVVLVDTRNVVKKASIFSRILTEIGNLIKKKQWGEATKTVASIKEQVNAENGPLFEVFKQQLKEREVNITVGKIKQELDQLITVDEFASKLSILNTLGSDEAKAIKIQIVNKIVQLTIEEAEQQLMNKEYSKAISTLDKGLSYSTENKELLSFKEKVENERGAFEKAEQKRLEQAMEAAAEEDLLNRTAAVEVNNVEATLDEYGDLYITGKVTNKATTGIYGITVYFTIYDSEGNYYDKGSRTVYPYSLNPGDEGNFEDIFYGVNQDVTVEVDNITWYLE